MVFHAYLFKELLKHPCRCGQKATHLHHIYPQAQFPEFVDEKWNLLAVCEDCHHKIHGQTTEKRTSKDIHPIVILEDGNVQHKWSKSNNSYLRIKARPEHTHIEETYFVWDQDIQQEIQELDYPVKVQFDTKLSKGYMKVKKMRVLSI